MVDAEADGDVPHARLTLPEVASRCRAGRSTVNQWIRGIWVGRTKLALPCLVVGTNFRVKVESLDEFLAAGKEARLGPDEPPPLPTSPAKRNREGRKAQERVAKRLAGRL